MPEPLDLEKLRAICPEAAEAFQSTGSASCPWYEVSEDEADAIRRRLVELAQECDYFETAFKEAHDELVREVPRLEQERDALKAELAGAKCSSMPAQGVCHWLDSALAMRDEFMCKRDAALAEVERLRESLKALSWLEERQTLIGGGSNAAEA